MWGDMARYGEIQGDTELELRRGHRVGLLAPGEAIEGVRLAEVPAVEDGAHARLLGLVVVGVDHHGLVRRQRPLDAHAAEERLRVGEAPVVERALGDARGEVVVPRGARHLLPEGRLPEIWG